MTQNACTLDGVSIRYDTFLPCMWRAVSRGWVTPTAAQFVHDGLRWGFRAGIQTHLLRGRRWFGNYPSAVKARTAVTRATMKRVEMGKTLLIGTWRSAMAQALTDMFTNSAIFPLRAVAKPLEPSEMRPTDDHTRTGVNAATDMTGLAHTLTAYKDIAWFLKLDYFMRVSDVDAAFPMLPLHPDVWPYFFFRFYANDATRTQSLFLHICGDFGTAGMPGVFKVFFVDVVLNMARSEGQLTLPMPVYVDDCGLIGPYSEEVDSEMLAFQAWAGLVCGVFFKFLKDRVAARKQLMLGLWWDSTRLSRELDPSKLDSYLCQLDTLSRRRWLTLSEMRQMAGRLQRAVLTLPPGSRCLLAPLYAAMSGLKRPWAKRNTTSRLRSDLRTILQMLKLNMGKGYYSYALHRRAPDVWTDASRREPHSDESYSGGGYFSACGRYCYFAFDSRFAREQTIDFMEGYTVLLAAESLAHLWRRCRVTFWIDNQSFQLSGAAGRSRVERLNWLLRRLLILQVEYDFVLEYKWISTHDNYLADHLSRGRIDDFLSQVESSGQLAPGAYLQTVGDPGVMVHLPALGRTQ